LGGGRAKPALRPSDKSLSLSSSWGEADKLQAAWTPPATINPGDKKFCLPHNFCIIYYTNHSTGQFYFSQIFHNPFFIFIIYYIPTNLGGMAYNVPVVYDKRKTRHFTRFLFPLLLVNPYPVKN
jgi:hypothetical protein